MYQFFLKGRDPISSLTHFIGACLSLLATIILVFQSVTLQETSLDDSICICIWTFTNCFI